MIWADVVDVDTLHNALRTMESLANHGEWPGPPVPTLDRFLCAVLAGRYRDMAVGELAAMEPLNVGVRRLSARTAAAAYPVHDRPRGKADLESVRRLRRRDTVASPVLVAVVEARGRNRKGETERVPVLLDGMHRLVAAAIDRRTARVCFVAIS